MKKKISILLVLAMSLTFALCACGKGAAKGKTLVYWTMWNEAEPQGKVVAEAAAAFEKETGNKIDVVFNGRDIRKTLQPALDGGTVIDFFDEDVERVNGTWGKYLLDIEEMAKKSYPTTNGKPFTDVVSKTMINLAREQGGGVLKTVPYQISTFVTMYNKVSFEKAGIAAPPKTWDEFLSACEKLKAAGITPITVDDAYMGALFGYHMDRLIGKDATFKMQEKNDFSNPGVLKFGQQWEELVKKGYVSKNATGNVYPAGQQEIASGSVAMYLNGTWLPNEIRDSIKDVTWGSFAYPAVDPAGDGIEANQFGAQCFGINKATKLSKEAFEFIVYMTTGKWDTKLAKDTLGVPMGNDSDWPAELADAKEILAKTTKRLPWAVGMENNADVHTKIKTNFALLLGGKLDAKGFAEAMQK